MHKNRRSVFSTLGSTKLLAGLTLLGLTKLVESCLGKGSNFKANFFSVAVKNSVLCNTTTFSSTLTKIDGTFFTAFDTIIQIKIALLFMRFWQRSSIKEVSAHNMIKLGLSKMT